MKRRRVSEAQMHCEACEGREEMTEAIFDRDPRELRFKARVLSCEERRTAAGESRFAVVLDRTAFFRSRADRRRIAASLAAQVFWTQRYGRA